MTSNPKKWKRISYALFAFVPFWSLSAQEVDESTDPVDDEEVIVLSPFTVNSEDMQGYTATATLAGTRVRTDLRDVAASISVVTEQFLDNTGATNSQDLLVYTTGTEVGGVYGNFSGLPNTQGAAESRNLTSPNTNTRVRGLDAADNTRDYFLTDIPWDGYNVDRVDLQRGPNSILFGVGSPAGIINAGLVPAMFRDSGEYENVISRFGGFRNSANFNKVLIEDTLAIRVAALYDERRFQQEPAFEDDSRVYGAVRFEPRLLGNNHGPLTIRANYETGDINANRPRQLTPVDRITPWWTGLNQQVFDPFWAWGTSAQIDRGNGGRTGEPNIPWLGQEMLPASIAAGFRFDNGNPNAIDIGGSTAGRNFGIDADGNIDRGIDGFIFGREQQVAGFNEYSKNAEAVNPGSFPGAGKNFYKDKHLTDPSVFNFYDQLIDGNNKNEWNKWDAYNIAVSQTFWDNRLGVEFVYDYQDYQQGRQGLWGGSVAVGIDVNSYMTRLPTEYPPTDVENGQDPNAVSEGWYNPNQGRAFVSGNSRAGGNSSLDRERENARLTVFGEFRADDVFNENSWIAKFLGRHTVTGLYNTDDRNQFNRSWNRFATDVSYAQFFDDPATAATGITEYDRSIPYVVYLSNNLSGVASPRGLDLPNVAHTIDLAGTYDVRVFDSTWVGATNAPDDYYALPFDGADSTQSENWRNYVGWTTRPSYVLNSNVPGEREQLYTAATKRADSLESEAITWQGYFFGGNLVPTYGWRRDTIETWGGSGPRDPITNVPSLDFEADRSLGVTTSEGETTTWGIVGHMPSFLEDRMPFGLRVSGFYNKSENFNPENRVGFDTNPIEPPAGESEDYGVVISALEDRLTLKVTKYETTVQRANIPGGNPLGNNTWFLANIEAWGTASAVTHELYWNGDLPGLAWFSNYGLVDENLWGAAGWENAPFSDEALNHPSNVQMAAAVQDWLATMPPQSFFDGYGLPIDRAAANSGIDGLRVAVDGGAWNPYNGIGSIQPSGGGLVNGLSPTGAVDQTSEGWEIELSARLKRGWDLTMNVAKTEASRGDLEQGFEDWINYQYERFQGPAGDIRLWWGGDQTIRTYYDQNIYQPYLFQLDQKGSSAPEIRPWRFNLVTNYSFQEGMFKGMNVGAAYRWQDDLILGYELDTVNERLDIARPINQAAEDAIDLWVGYNKQLTEKIGWRIQLNLRNVGESDRLIPISINPDGEWAAVRIANGMRWSVTNTFSF